MNTLPCCRRAVWRGLMAGGVVGAGGGVLPAPLRPHRAGGQVGHCHRHVHAPGGPVHEAGAEGDQHHQLRDDRPACPDRGHVQRLQGGACPEPLPCHTSYRNVHAISTRSRACQATLKRTVLNVFPLAPAAMRRMLFSYKLLRCQLVCCSEEPTAAPVYTAAALCFHLRQNNGSMTSSCCSS